MNMLFLPKDIQMRVSLRLSARVVLDIVMKVRAVAVLITGVEGSDQKAPFSLLGSSWYCSA